eukprot:589812-Prymnesium_polylepis.1
MECEHSRPHRGGRATDCLEARLGPEGLALGGARNQQRPLDKELLSGLDIPRCDDVFSVAAMPQRERRASNPVISGAQVKDPSRRRRGAG